MPKLKFEQTVVVNVEELSADHGEVATILAKHYEWNMRRILAMVRKGDSVKFEVVFEAGGENLCDWEGILTDERVGGTPQIGSEAPPKHAA